MDHVVIESTALSGTDNFEELANVEDVERLEDVFKKRVTELTSQSTAA